MIEHRKFIRILLLILVAVVIGRTAVIGANAESSTSCDNGMNDVSVARSYYIAAAEGKTEFSYNQNNKFGENNGIDCSTFASLCLRGISYEDSPFVSEEGYHTNSSDSITLRGAGAGGWAKDVLDGRTDYASYSERELNYRLSADVIAAVNSRLSDYSASYQADVKQKLSGVCSSKPYYRNWKSYTSGGKKRYYIDTAADIADVFRNHASGTTVVYENYRTAFNGTSSDYKGHYDDSSGTFVKNDSSYNKRLEQLKPGDLVFWSKSAYGNPKQMIRYMSITHVGIVAEDRDYFYEVSSSGKVVLRSRLSAKSDEIVLVLRPDYTAYNGSASSMLSVPKLTLCENQRTGTVIKWEPVPGASAKSGIRYRVFVKSGNSSWSRLGDTDSTSWTYSTGTVGVRYTYTVRCVTADGKTYLSGYDAKGVSSVYAVPRVYYAKRSGVIDAIIRWTLTRDNTRYRIFVKRYGTSVWRTIANVTRTVPLSNTTHDGVQYIYTAARKGDIYTVRAVSSDGKNYTTGYEPGLTVIW